ncbi:thiamine-phosphate kinase [Thermophagus sp. OGC60D27]|uniref:thiamine-phosphate kinase n=1 Tax=Thermophagus sp. OGC60D27 TaxID=3458415 RepID=UPI004037B9FB
MKLSDIGEFGFIERITEKFPQIPLNGITGIGDDCAIIPQHNDFEMVVTTDLLVEDIHFLRDKTTPFDLGYKSLAVNLSDIAAMGALPVASFLSIAIPANLDVNYLDQFIDGYKTLSNKYKVPLLGGDTTKSPDKLTINVCVLGKVKKGKALKRSSAQLGDIIAVTGPLGDSGGGLRLILEDIQDDNEAYNTLIHWHHRPEPAVREGLTLSSLQGIRAMMDISDGLASDLGHILKASGCEATVDLTKIPISDSLKKVSTQQKWNVVEIAVSAGEDYRLLLTIDHKYYDKVAESYNKEFSLPLTPIGSITGKNSSGKIEWTKNGKPTSFSGMGFNHFSKKN